MFLVMTLSSIIISATTTGADHNDDRIGTILSYMVQMRDDMKLLSRKVDGVQKEVKDVSRVEELTSEHLLKLEDKVADVIDKQEKMESRLVGHDQSIESQVSAVFDKVYAVKNEVIAVQNQISEVYEKVEKVDNDMFVAPALRWSFIGNGVRGSCDDGVSKSGFYFYFLTSSSFWKLTTRM